ncbi:MAG: hypothetical protein QXG75_04940, partial [Candidatus Caldarchaeum sp.]
KNLFLKPEVTDQYVLAHRPPSDEKVLEILVEEFDFSRDRVLKALEELRQATAGKSTSLDAFFN